MSDTELFASAARSAGDKAGVFEHDGDVGYFYLYETLGKKDHKVRASIRILVGAADFSEQDIAIRWSSTESFVGLFIRDQLWAAFDVRTGAKYGGDYDSTGAHQPKIPSNVRREF